MSPSRMQGWRARPGCWRLSRYSSTWLVESGPGSTVFALTGLYYLVFYALPVFLFSPGHWPSGVDATGTEYGLRVANIGVEAQLVVFLGLAALIAAYYACRIPIQNRLPFIRLPAAAPERLRPLLWALLAAHLAYVFIPALSAIPSIGQFLLPVGPLAAGMLLVLSHRGKLPRGEWLLIAIVIAMIFFRIIATGLLTEIVLFCGFLAAALHHAGSRWCWFYAVLPFVIVAALYSPVKLMRTTDIIDRPSPAGPDQAGSLGWTVFHTANNVIQTVDVAIKYWGKDNEMQSSRFMPLVRRISRIVVFSYVYDKTPDEVPFFDGASYRPLLTAIVPRLVWRDKPEVHFGQVFGHRYRIIWPSDRITSSNVSWLIEMYANFGIVGVILGMVLAGTLLACLMTTFNNPAMSSLEFVTGSAVIFWLAYPDSNLSLMTGSIPVLALSLWLYFRFGIRLTMSLRPASAGPKKE